MKKYNAADRRQRLRLILAIPMALLLMNACEPADNRLGADILPPGDSILTFADTLYDLRTRIITPEPIITSISADNESASRIYLLGSKNDTITGFSSADIVTQVVIGQAGIFGTNPRIDSIEVSLYVTQVEGDTSLDFRLKVYEITEDLDYYEDYYSDYDVTGKYDPEPLVDKSFRPRAGKMHTFYINDPELQQRLLDAAADSVFRADSLVKKTIRGLYITADPFTGKGAFAKIQLSSNFSRMGFRYLHDSVNVDTATFEDYDRYYMSFYYKVLGKSRAQSINIFSHDKTGSGVEAYIDNPDAVSRVAYVQGMAGVNVRISLPDDLLELANSGPVAINSARLLLNVVPDSISGISAEDYPSNMMLSTIAGDGTTAEVYDYLVNPDPTIFGNLSRTFDISAFVDPVYQYSFNLGMHIQSVINGDIPLEESDLLLYIRNPYLTSKNMKLWSNHSGHETSPRLELVYSRF